jgi:hypothetical protein
MRYYLWDNARPWQECLDWTTEVLETAIQCRGAFRRFKDVLQRYPGEMERWFKFKNERMYDRASEWLDAIGVSLSKA